MGPSAFAENFANLVTSEGPTTCTSDRKNNTKEKASVVVSQSKKLSLTINHKYLISKKPDCKKLDFKILDYKTLSCKKPSLEVTMAF